MAAGLLASERLEGADAAKATAWLGPPDGRRRDLSYSLRAPFIGTDRFELTLDPEGRLRH